MTAISLPYQLYRQEYLFVNYVETKLGSDIDIYPNDSPYNIVGRVADEKDHSHCIWLSEDTVHR